MEIVKRNGLEFLTSDKIDAIHGFTLRHGGVSQGDFSSLNMGLRRGDNPFNAIKNIEKCADALMLDKEKLTLTYQLHTAKVHFLTPEDIGKGFCREWGEGVDGIVTDMKNVPLLCYSADCVPTLLYDKKRGMIGAVHGGWRGTKDNIIANAVDVMIEHGAKVEDICAFIGPAIGICCYEVSEDVGEQFAGEYESLVIKKDNGKYMLDLKSITASQLMEKGVLRENIENCCICTSCRNDMFFSHRAQKGRSGLLGGFIQMI
ncbi:MAG: peptidoglycan editing factor PgeF [Clostridia bacterium]|nr:peptidoglycan editing factor PgeF [Clostridia bacterium]